MTDWITPLQQRLAEGRPVVRLAVAARRGSAPREAGATLLYWSDAEGRTCSLGSIGGGHLEARAIEIAAHLLSGSAEARRVERFVLGASLGQCCGGVVELYWERFERLEQVRALAAADLSSAWLRGCALDGSGREWLLSPAGALAAGWPVAELAAGAIGAALVQHVGARHFVERLVDERVPLWIYGAGHVGRALVGALADLPFRLTWVDSRAGMLAQAMEQAAQRVPGRGIDALAVDAPEDAAADAPADAWHLVMTHSHDEDFRLCETLLRCGDFGFLGVIGSQSKSLRFRQRLRQRGHEEAQIGRMVSPIGLGPLQSKLPAAIAVSVAAQLLWLHERRAACAPPAAAGETFSFDSSDPVPIALGALR